MNIYFSLSFLVLFSSLVLTAQTQRFSLEDCIEYALENSTSVGRAENNVEVQNANLEQSKAARFPNLQFAANQGISSNSSYNTDIIDWNRKRASSFNTTLSSQVTLYNGAKLKNSIHQSKIELDAANMDIQIKKELISLDILSAYINVLLTKENVANNQLQLEATQEQLTFTEARKEAGSIALSELLYIKSQLATNKTNLIQAKNDHQIALVSLMQLMNMPLNSTFDIVQISVDELISAKTETNALVVYNAALGIQPSIKSAEMNIESAKTNIKIAKADAMPKLTLNGSLSSTYVSDYYDINFGEQYTNKFSPAIGLNLSVPIFQQRKVKTQVKIAEIQVDNYKLELIDQQNNLRKYIEQACTDALLAESNFEALQEQYAAEKEAYEVGAEMFKLGMINSVEFLTSKNNLMVAESKFTQAKYTLVMQKEIIEYYLGNAIAL